MPSKPTDSELIAQVIAAGNQHAYGVLVDRYQGALRRFFLHQTCGDTALSDDLAQDSFVKAYTSIRSFRGDSQFSTWLFRIAYNVWCDHLRRQKTTIDIEQAKAVKQLSTVSTGLSLDLQKALAILSETERLCVTLQIVDGYSIDEISHITSMPQGTVKSHLFRGKEKLTTYLKHNGYDRK